MIKNYSSKIIIFFFLAILFSCQQKREAALSPKEEADILHENEDQLTQLIIYDVFTPPVASRIYAYTSLAAYEAIRFKDSSKQSIAEQLRGFDSIPKPSKEKTYNFSLAATKAFFTVARKLTFSVDSLKKHEGNVYGRFERSLDESTFEASVGLGEQIAAVILKRAANDNYKKTRGGAKFLGSFDQGQWRPTAPDYLDGVEAYWGTMKTMALDSTSQFSLIPPPAFSLDKESDFYKQNVAVYNKSNTLTQEEKDIAKYWDDNPFVLEHSGHLTFANKKITPGGHWIGITTIACKATNADAVKSAQAYALASVAMYDAFISCWKVKYQTNYIRPITSINDLIDKRWTPKLQTPPFPEYPSGHSTITRASAVVLTRLFGDNFAFRDTSDLKYIGMQRDFTSFYQASDEASISRFYGGIHYRNSVDQGVVLGNQVGEYFLNKIKL